MNYLVVSDSHGYNEHLKEVVKRVSPKALFHLGDLQCPLAVLEKIAGCPVYAVAGNNDVDLTLKRERLEIIEGHRIAMTHGHRQGANYGISRLAYWGEEQEAEVVMFGHTHIPLLRREGSVMLLNPGSISLPRQDGRKPTFTIMEIDKSGLIHFSMNKL